jgi:PTS system galactosamine-specific IIB component
VDDKDLEDLRAIRNAGVEVYIQIAPGDRRFDFEIK